MFSLLIATVLNMRPDLFKAAILNVPFLDVLTSLMDKSLALTVTDHEEFGNPIEVNVQDFYDLLG
jgi:oligopeptidase B